MSIPAYAFVNDLPAPVTTGTAAQYFTDVMGEVWVARNGVNSGNWARARAVLYCRCYRAAAYTSPALNSTFVMDAAVDDVYGLFASPNIVAPIPGQWLAGAVIEIIPTATSDMVAFYLNFGAASLRSGTANAFGGLVGTRSSHSAVFNAGTAPFNIWVSTEYTTAGRAVTNQDGRTFLWAKYMGA